MLISMIPKIVLIIHTRLPFVLFVLHGGSVIGVHWRTRCTQIQRDSMGGLQILFPVVGAFP